VWIQRHGRTSGDENELVGHGMSSAMELRNAGHQIVDCKRYNDDISTVYCIYVLLMLRADSSDSVVRIKVWFPASRRSVQTDAGS
jgi:hypothetical protein